MSVDRKNDVVVFVVAGVAAASGFVACVGDEFKGPSRDAALETGAGGETPGSGGSGGKGSGASTPVTGGSANGGTGSTANGGTGGGAIVDAGSDASDGGLPPPACVRDEDCAPFTCRGAPSCREGVCTPGDPCEAPTDSACTSECVRSATRASCVVMGRDGDKDGHRDARCAEAPGDDCDDAQPAVYGAATEICDGLDNDCDGRTDVFDGIAPTSSVRLIAPIANTALLALVKRTSGYALMTAEMLDYYAGKGNPTDVRLLGFDGGEQKAVSLSGSLNVIDPALTSLGDELMAFGYRSTGTENVLTMARRIDAAGVLQEEVAVPRATAGSQVWGRAGATLGGDALFAWAEHPATSSQPAGGIAHGTVDTDGAFGRSYVQSLGPGAGSVRAYRPNIVVTGPDAFAVAWAERAFAPDNEVTFNIHLTYKSDQTSSFKDVLVDTYRLPIASTELQGESARPQVTFDGVAFTVGSLGPARSLQVRRIATDGKPLCIPTKIPDVLAWGAAGSLASTRQGVIAVATATNGDVVLYRVSAGPSSDEQCAVQRGPTLNAPAKRVASSTTFEKGQLDASLGNPVVLLGKDDAVLTAWVERDRTAEEAAAAGTQVQTPAEPHGIVLRVLGSNLCD